MGGLYFKTEAFFENRTSLIFAKKPVLNQKVNLEFPNGITLHLKRDDLIHPHVSGNKFRKLKYNLIQAKKEGKTTLLTFGGAFSNHIAAVAAAGKEFGFQTIGIIRGEELHDKVEENPTLSFAHNCGMHLDFVSRAHYRDKERADFLKELEIKYGAFYLLPEGGTNALAIKGCSEILSPDDTVFTHVCCAVGTGGTLSGIINSTLPHQKTIGFPALKGDFLSEEIRNFVSNSNWELRTEYHFGGYGKIKESLVQFINDFYKQTNIPLDPIYTGKMMYGIFDLIQQGFFSDQAAILAIHTGGLQGVEGMNQKRINNGLPIIKIK